jgi:hypothetical protein
MKQVIVVTGASSGLALWRLVPWLMRDILCMPACVKQRAAMPFR